MFLRLIDNPNYSFSFTHNDNVYDVELNARNGNTYISYSINKKQIAYNLICLNKVVINSLFMFYSKENIDPYYTNFDKFAFWVQL